MFENIDWLPGRDSHMLPIGEQRLDKCFVFSLHMFRERSLKRSQGPIRERKAEAQGNETSGLFLAY